MRQGIPYGATMLPRWNNSLQYLGKRHTCLSRFSYLLFFHLIPHTMELIIKDPADGQEMKFKVEPEMYGDEQGMRVIFPEKDSFVMVYRGEDNWEVVDEEFVNPDLVKIIGKALHPRAHYVSNSNPS